MLVERTPPDRDRLVDLLRAVALAAVVTGHWLKQGWYVDTQGGLHRAGLLGIAEWTHPFTWVFQVMPVVFVVGGYADRRSWMRARSESIGYGAWLAGRTERLTRPLVPLLLFWIVVTPTAPLLGLDDDWLRIASRTSLVPTWFLATYVVVVAMTPWLLRLWERWGTATLVAAAALAVAVDTASILSGSTALGLPNLVLVWGTLHLLGMAWSDGWFDVPHRAAWCAAAGLALTAALVRVGPYSVSLVGVDGYGVNNTYPPRATLLFLGFFLVGTAVAAGGHLRRLLAHDRPWAGVLVVESRLMTVYLWHLTALGLLGAASLHLGGLGLHARPATATWWLQVPGWFALLTCTTLVLVLLVGRWEEPTGRRAVTDIRPALPLLEVAVTAAGLGVLASRGMTDGVLTWTVAVVTVVALVVLDRLLCPDPRRRTSADART